MKHENESAIYLKGTGQPLEGDVIGICVFSKVVLAKENVWAGGHS